MSRLHQPSDAYSNMLSSLPEYPQAQPVLTELGFWAKKFPKRVLRWLYSFSLIIFMFWTFAFIVATPLDIVIQTFGSALTGIKTLIVIGACAVFFLVSVVLYFLRLYQSRVEVNQIPSKSVYIPLEKNDMPKDVLTYIEGTLRKCVGETGMMAGPLKNETEVINFPGMSPPEYIQRRNIDMGFPEEGTFLPPNSIYEDVVDSLGTKLRFDGVLVTNFDIPMSYTFREIVISMSKILVDEHELDASSMPNVQKVVELYEKFKFSPDLIQELDLLAFLVEFERLSLIFHTNRLSHGDRHHSTAQASEYSEGLLTPFSPRGGSSIFRDSSRSNSESVMQMLMPFQQSHLSRTSTRTSTRSERLVRGRTGSTGSVIKSHISIGRDKLSLYAESDAESSRGYNTDFEDQRSDHSIA